ncbi:hypothetical protein ACFLS1_09825, partial [Verrucomicrobiota bacterium]
PGYLAPGGAGGQNKVRQTLNSFIAFFSFEHSISNKEFPMSNGFLSLLDIPCWILDIQLLNTH